MTKMKIRGSLHQMVRSSPIYPVGGDGEEDHTWGDKTDDDQTDFAAAGPVESTPDKDPDLADVDGALPAGADDE